MSCHLSPQPLAAAGDVIVCPYELDRCAAVLLLLFLASPYAYINTEESHDDAEAQIDDGVLQQIEQVGGLAAALSLNNNSASGSGGSASGSDDDKPESSDAVAPLGCAPVCASAPMGANRRGKESKKSSSGVRGFFSNIFSKRKNQSSPRDESSSSSGSASRPAPPPAAGARGIPGGAPVSSQCDTNVISLQFGQLAQPAAVTRPVQQCYKCDGCGVAFSHLSRTEQQENKGEQKENQQAEGQEGQPNDQSAEAQQPPSAPLLWKCEFCYYPNEIPATAQPLSAEQSTVDYTLEVEAEQPGNDVEENTTETTGEDGLIVFCVDVSGSMEVTTEVQGKVELKGANHSVDASLRNYPDYMPHPARNDVTYISRLQCVQAAITAQLKQLGEHHPTKKVVLVTFSSAVTIVGDGQSASVDIAASEMYNEQALKAAGGTYQLSDNTIGDSHGALTDKVFALQAAGSTALGPALQLSIALASRRPGSSVILCTDGLANVGLGSLDVRNDAAKQKTAQWYNDQAEVAKQAGVVVNVISIAGSGEVGLQYIGSVVTATGGTVDIVNPLELTTNFTGILKNPVIATNVTLTVFLASGLVFRNEVKAENKLTIEVGNVTTEREQLFEYTVLSSSNAQSVSARSSLPFQVQLQYTTLNGRRLLRCITAERATTSKREEAERDVKVELLAANVAQKSSAHAGRGDYHRSKVNTVAWSGMLQRVAAKSERDQNIYNNYLKVADNLHKAVTVQQTVEEQAPKGAGARTIADERYTTMAKCQSLSSAGLI